MRAERALRVALLLPALLLVACRAAETPVYTTQFVAFDAAVDLSIVGKLKDEAQTAASEVEQDFLFIEHATHAWKPGPMTRVNELLPTGEPFAAPPSLLPLLRQSQALSLQSQGLFNPAIGHLYRLWGFQTEEPQCRPPPSRASIARLVKAHPSMDDLYLDGIMLQSDNPAVRLDFSAIVVGYAMDLAMDNLRTRGVRDALVNVSGDVRTMGDRAGRPWRVPVRRGSGGGVLGILDVVGDMAVFTSSEYARNFIYDGKTYHDVIDPRTGYPAEGLQAVTVLYQGSAAVADAAAYALMVAGPGGWQDIAARLGLRYVLLIDDAGTVHMTPAMAQRIQLIDPHTDVEISAPIGAHAQKGEPGA
ncbi:MAG: FAD:protein FMN transferase [Thiohalocapsa sp.]|uniref:FAD:protein FMN transferase n=1 Tax=Thiohalocapsa sp. TaxID=2497641 RepID=UPI0025F94419|nr:FAD:protein FMN transferase [Thiohalocapsa sp.]MCG6942669.1 FAD:protein FMN transferase [Thiohalocapsa sp.]